MIRMEMKYFNTYYFCSVAEYLMIEGDLDFARTLDEFTTRFDGIERMDFSKESYLHYFVEFMVERILFEQNEYLARDVENAIIQDGFEEVMWGKHEVFHQKCLGEKYRYTMFETAIKKYENSNEKLQDWIIHNCQSREFDSLEVALEYTEYLEEKYYNVIDRIKKEVVYLLFQNRNFLMHFNIFLSDTIEGKSKRTTVPKWVQRAVYYRDNGRCIICQKDLSGLIDIEEDFQKQLDHIVPLEEGGINDLSNMHLMCKECNLKKGIKTYTSQIYRFMYDDEN